MQTTLIAGAFGWAMILVVLLVVQFIFLFGLYQMLNHFYRKVEVGYAIVRTGVGGYRVAVGQGMWVVPSMHRGEVIDLTSKAVTVTLKDLICREDTRAVLRLVALIRVDDRTESIIHIAQSVGCARASDPEQVTELFAPKLRDAAAQVAQRFTAEEIVSNRDGYLEQIILHVGTDLAGFVLEDMAIDEFYPK